MINKILISLLIFFLFLWNIYYFYENSKLKEFIKEKENNTKINRKYFIENISLKDYANTKFKLTDEWKSIIKNIRNFHKWPTLIAENHLEKDLCAGYIWILSEKLWWKFANYSIGMMNTKTKKCASSWEIPHFYEAFWWKILVDFSKKFSLEKKDFVEKINLTQLKNFFAKSFSEKAIFWDIWFLYKDTSHLKKLETWNYNSHITKNMWVSEFSFVFTKIDNKKSNLENFLENLTCDSSFKKYVKLFENYKFYLNNREISFYNSDFYFIENNVLKQKVDFKYLDKITYEDITLTHFFKKKSRVNWLLEMSCSWEFFLINVISINSRMIEKM